MSGTLLALAWAGWAILIAWIDWRHRRVNNRWWLIALPLALPTPFVLHDGWAWAVFLSLTGLLLALVLHLGVWSRGWIGGADVKAYAIVGWSFGALVWLEVFAIASLMLAVAACLHRLRAEQPHRRIPMLPALSASVLAWIFTGPWWVGGQGF